MKPKVFLGSDHAAYQLKSELNPELFKDYDVIDLGTESNDRCHYPEFAQKVAQAVLENPGSRGILMCGSGIGMSITANKFKGIRAALCRTLEEAELSRQHNDANILCLGARTNSRELNQQIIATWLKTDFEGGRHADRVAMMDQLGQ